MSIGHVYRAFARAALRHRAAWLVALPLVAAAPTTPVALYMPRSYRLAIARGTRSLDGRPGPRYWENHARYRITLDLAPPDRDIRGTEHITYRNDSPDSLRHVVFKVFMNVHKPGAPRMSGVDTAYLTRGVRVDSFRVNGVAAPWPNDARNFTSVPVKLPAPLAPQDSVAFDLAWRYTLAPADGNREGIVDSTTYYLAYFYPRVAVYDDVEGWDTMNFTGSQEFYSDFNDYDVTLNLPGRFVVWGTGTLANASSVLEPEYLRRFQTSLTSDTTIRIATARDVAAHAVTHAGATNAWHFTSTYVPDVAFGVSDHYDWDGGSVVVDATTHRRASVQAAYNDTAADFHHMVRFASQSMTFLSRQWPGVPYPYEKSTVFQGGAGMEYPMMINDESYGDTTFSHIVAEHEMAHTYMPFYMGIDETRYGFMDEGWATTFEYLLERDLMPEPAADELYRRFRVVRWIHDSSVVEDLPVVTPEDMLHGAAYGDNAYVKPSLGYLAMKDLLGDALFRKCLHAYMDRWHGRHPQPWDFFHTFDSVSGRDLDWFWRSWFFDNSYIDLGVRAVRPARGGYTVEVQNIGGMPAPFNLDLRFADGSGQMVHETPAVWMADQKMTRVTVATAKRLRSLTLDGGVFMDADTTNNVWRAR